MVTWGLFDQAQEYGLPDKCLTQSPTDAQLQTELRIKYALVGAASPGYAICLAASLGYAIFIEEVSPARVNRTRIGDRLFGPRWGDVFYVHAPTVTVTRAIVGRARIGDRLASWGNSELECAIRAAAQPQTWPLFALRRPSPTATHIDEFRDRRRQLGRRPRARLIAKDIDV